MIKMNRNLILPLFLSIIWTTSIQCFLVEPGRLVTLKCQKNVDTSLVWDKVGSTTGAIAIDQSVQGNQGGKFSLLRQGAVETLTLNGITLEDDGVYRCYTLFLDDYEYHNVTVIVPPESVEVRPNSNNVYEGEYNTLLCVSRSSKPAPTMEWHVQYPDNTYEGLDGRTCEDLEHENKTITRTCSVDVFVTELMMQSVFICVVTQLETGYEKQLHLSLAVNTYPDQPEITGGESAALENQHYSLLCKCSGGQPAATLQWIWGGDKVNSKTWVVEKDDGTFVSYAKIEFLARRVRNGDLFECEATNRAMWVAGAAPFVANYTLVVHYAPTILVLPTTVAAWEGETVTLSCSTDANPSQTTVTWYRDETLITPETNEVFSTTSRDNTYVLEINSITKEYAGSYQCAVENTAGTGYGDIITVNVFHNPICATRQKFKYAAHMGGTVSMQCTVEAFPAVATTFNWVQNRTALSTQAGFTESQVSHEASSKFDYTIYSSKDYYPVECSVNNGVGQMQKPCVFRILKPGPAEPPTDCIATGNTSESLTIECVEVFSGGSTAYYALQNIVAQGYYTTVQNSTKPTFIVEDLFPSQNYQFRICASNSEFHGTVQCGLQLQMTTAPGPPKVVRVSDDYSSDYWPYVYTACAIGGMIVILLIIVAAVFLYKAEQEKRKEEAVRTQNDLFMSPSRPMDIHEDTDTLPPYSPSDPESAEENVSSFYSPVQQPGPSTEPQVPQPITSEIERSESAHSASGISQASTVDVREVDYSSAPLRHHQYDEDTSSIL